MLDQFVVLEKDEMKNLFNKLEKLPDKLNQMQLMQAALGGGVYLDLPQNARNATDDGDFEFRVVVSKEDSGGTPVTSAAILTFLGEEAATDAATTLPLSLGLLTIEALVSTSNPIFFAFP